MDEEATGGKPGVPDRSLKRMAQTTATDIVGKPLGFGDVLFAEQKEMAPVITLFPVQASPQFAALAA